MTSKYSADPLRVLVRAEGAGFPLHPDADHRHGISPDDPALGLSEDLAADLHEWAGSRPASGVPSRQVRKEFTRKGLELSTRLASELGPFWIVSYYDEVHGHTHRVCWECGGLHWVRNTHKPLTGLQSIEVRGEYGCYPLWSGDESFAPDDPVVGLGLTDDLVDRLYAWSDGVQQLINGDPPQGERQRLTDEGLPLARRLAGELGSQWTVVYHGLDRSTTTVVSAAGS